MPRKGGSGSSRSSGGGGRTYVNNSMNQSLGRVGMALGSAPVSRSAGGGASYGSSRSSSSQSYGPSSSYNSSSSSGYSGKTYVDNSQNRILGRAGMPMGSAPVSRSSNAAYSSTSNNAKTYVDNSQNRILGRVGMALGSASVSRSSNASYCSPSKETKTYVDNSQNRILGRAGMPLGSAPASSSRSSSKTYTDNSFNRRLGRVGQPIGTAVSSRNPASPKLITSSQKSQKCYIDNDLNRKLGRVGMKLGSMSISRSPKKQEIQHAYRQYAEDPSTGFEQYNPYEFYQDGNRYQDFEGYQKYNPLDQELYQNIQEMFERMKCWEQERESKYQQHSLENQRRFDHVKSKPFQTYKGAVILYEDLIIDNQQRIGHGGFGDVFVAKWADKRVAIKKLRVQRVSRRRLEQFETEINKLYRLRHENIIEFHGASIKTPNLCIVMELMQGSLYDKIHIEEYQFSNENKIFITKEIACGLQYLHSEHAAHCDIKSSNILVNIFDEDTICVKLTDFGLTMMKADASTSTSSSRLVADIGTPKYSAPEILRGEMLDLNDMFMTDVYSYGIVIFEIYSEEEPFEDLNLHQLRAQVGSGSLTPPVDKLCNEIDSELVFLMKKCWSREPKSRPTMKYIVATLRII